MRIAVLTFLALSLICTTLAQDAHWGVQGDIYSGTVPSQIVDHFKDLVEKPDISAKAYNAGLVRFHGDGSPNWAVEFTKTQFSISGSRAFSVDPLGGVTTITAPGTVAIIRSGDFIIGSLGSAQVHGSADLRGVMATKYLNFFARKHVSAGLAFGGGLGQLEATYTHFYQIPTAAIFAPPNHYSYVVPTFQILAQADVRPVRWIGLSPFYGIRNGTFGFGGAVRIHFTR